MCQQHPQFLTAYRLHMHRTIKPRPHHLRYAARSCTTFDIGSSFASSMRQGAPNHDPWPTPHLPPGAVHLRILRVCHQRNTCLQKADDAKQRAAEATEPFMKSAYEKVAEHWTLLARLESLIGNEKINEDAQQARP